jgi:WD repeat-containing protein 22
MAYTTRQLKNETLCPVVDIPSCSWSPDGKYLGAIFHNHFPTIYLATDPDPICVLESKTTGNQFYQSRITMKSASFSETSGRLQFVAGSEDYRAYGWDIPNLEEMLETRASNLHLKQCNFQSFLRNERKISPMIIQKPTFISKRHKSIVNSVASHPTLPMLVTAGVEKTIRIFSSFDIGDDLGDNNDPIDDLGDNNDPMTIEDDEVIAYFQSLVNSCNL